MLTAREVASLLNLSKRHAITLIRSHPLAVSDGIRLLLPARALPDLEARDTRPGRKPKA